MADILLKDKYYNPLDDFESYSIQYVLLAARSTAAAKDFADISKATATMAAIDNANYLGSPIAWNGSSNDVFLVLDTRRFSQFTVENLKYDVYLNGIQKGVSTSNLAADLSMTVFDSVGISFANYMQWLIDKQLRTNYDGMIFLLKVIFVGHTPRTNDGETPDTTTIQSETIPMHLTKMDIDLSFAKGVYNLEFMPNLNFDVNRHARLLSISTATSFHTDEAKGNKLGAMIDSFENALNDASSKFYNKVQSDIEQAAINAKRPKPRKYGRLVKYQITIPDSWKDWAVIGVSVGTTVEKIFESQKEEDALAAGKTQAQIKAEKDQRTQTAANIKSSHTSVQPGTTITKVLDSIFRQVKEIKEMGNFKQAAKDSEFVTFYKHIVGITSDNESMTVHVDVVEFKVPNVVEAAAKPNQISQYESEVYDLYKDGSTIKRIPKDFVEFDYIFTGRNKDVLSFDLKIQEFQYLLASNLNLGGSIVEEATANAEDVSTDQNKEQEAANRDLMFSREYDPLVLPFVSKAEQQNFTQFATQYMSKEIGKELVKTDQQYSKNLSMFYAGSPITAVITIRGNPLIMQKFNIGRFLPDSNDSKSTGPNFSTTSKAEYRKMLDAEILKSVKGSAPAPDTSRGSFVVKKLFSDKSYTTSPVFAKVNIMGPRVDPNTNDPLEPQYDEAGNLVAGTYDSSVLSDNFYVIFKLTNNISGHSFTQDLELYSHNIFGRSKIVKK